MKNVALNEKDALKVYLILVEKLGFLEENFADDNLHFDNKDVEGYYYQICEICNILIPEQGD